mgnify:CR=1 FL=1
MIKKLFDSFFLLLSSGVLLHRSTISGALCAIWAALTADPDESAFACLMNIDLYFALAVFLAFYRFTFKKVARKDKTLDLQEMGMGFLGDFVWAVLAMVCTVPFFLMMTQQSQVDYAERARIAVDPRSLMKKIPRPF